MSDTQNDNRTVPGVKRPGRGRKLLLGLAILVLLLVLGGFIATTSPFLKAVVLPRVSAALGAEISVGSIRLSPWSQLLMKDVTLRTAGAEPLLQVKEARVKYRLPELLGGSIRIREIDVVEPKFTSIQNADGTSNLDPMLEAMAPKPGAPPKPPSVEPLKITIDRASITQASLRFIQHQKNGSRQTIVVDNLGLSVDQLANGQPGRISLNANIKAEKPAGPTVQASESGSVTADVRGQFAFTLSDALWPQALQGQLDVKVTQGEGALLAYQGLALTWECDVQAHQIQKAVMALKRGSEDLAQLRVYGSYDLDKREADVRAELGGIDRRLLNVLGTAKGWDLGQSVLSATNSVKITEGGNVLAVSGEILARQVSVRQTNMTSPEMDFSGAFQVSVDRRSQKVQVERLNLSARQRERELVRASLDRPMILVWDTNAASIPDSAFQLSVTNLNLADWRALSDGKVRAGLATANLRLQSQEGGQRLGFDLSARLTDLSTHLAAQPMDGLAVRLQTAGRLANLAQLQFDTFQFELRQQNRLLAELDGSGAVDFIKTNLQAQLNLKANLSETLAVVPVPELRLSSGTLQFNGQISQTNGLQNLRGKITVSSLTGGYATNYQFQGFHIGGDADLVVQGQKVEVRKASLVLGDAGRDGQLGLNGRWDLNKAGGEIAFRAQKVTHTALDPFLKPWLAPRSLEALTLDATGTVFSNSQDAFGVHADFQAANLKLSDLQHRIPVMPLDLRGSVSATFPVEGDFQIKTFEVQTQANGQPSGAVRLNASLNPSNYNGQITFHVTNVNQNLLAPWMNPILAPQRLASIQLHSAGTARWGANCQMTAGFSVTNLVIQGQTTTDSKAPLSLGIKLDGSLDGTLMNIRELNLAFGPTSRASNQLEIRGQLGLAGAGAGQTNRRLSIRSQALDLTQWYNAWEAINTTNQAGNIASAKDDSNTEPTAIHLPISDGVIDFQVDRFYLRDIGISNWVATAAVKGDEINLKPFQFVLNGVPVSSTLVLNVGIPGYIYNLGLTTDRMPLQPFFSVFKPEFTAETHGDLNLNVQLKGAGITGPNLRKNLTGHADISVTNAQIRLAPKSNRLLEPIAALLRLDELIKARILGLQARLQMGSGQIILQPVQVSGDAFQASLQGGIPIADLIANSPLDLPVEFSLERGLAGKSGLLPADVPTNLTFVSLPSFAKVQGTLGKPETRTDKFVIAGLIARSAANLPALRRLGSTNTLGKIGDLLLGPAPASTSQPAGSDADKEPPAKTTPDTSDSDDSETAPDPSSTPSSKTATPSTRTSMPGVTRTNLIRPQTAPSPTPRPSVSTNQSSPARRTPFLRNAPANTGSTPASENRPPTPLPRSVPKNNP
jgi:hypothetical protein